MELLARSELAAGFPKAALFGNPYDLIFETAYASG